MKQSSLAKVCKIHGDFIAYNMICDSVQDIHILDFGDARTGFNFEDVVRFWEHIWAISQSIRWKSSFFVRINEAFLSGYGLTPSTVKDQAFVMLRLYNGLTNLLSYHFSINYMGWRSRWVNQRITNSSLMWAKEEIASLA